MKLIEFKVKSDQLNVIISALNRIAGEVRKDPESLFVQSVCSEINKKLSTKAISKSDSKKEFKISLKYHEGYALYQVMDAVIGAKDYGIYEQNAALKIFNEIDRQL